MQWMPIDLRHLGEYPCLNWEVWVLLRGVTKGSRLALMFMVMCAVMLWIWIDKK